MFMTKMMMNKQLCQFVLFLLALQRQNQSVFSLPFYPRKPPSLSDAMTATDASHAADMMASTTALAAATTTTAAKTALIQAELLRRAPGLALAGFLSFGLDPLVEQLFNVTHLTWNKGSYRSTFLYAAADSVEIAGKVYGILQLLDWLLDTFPQHLSKICPIQADLAVVAPQVGVTIWAARFLARLKNLFIKKAVYGQRYGKVAVLDRVLDFSIAIAAGYNIVNQLQINMGLGLRSLFAASGASAIVLSLASKDLLEQLVAGLLLQAWDAIDEGEYVKLSDGTEGTITAIGLLETEIVGSDYVPIRVPNTQIIGKKVSLYSKVTKSQLHQVLRFKYSDLDKIPQLLVDIQDEIQARIQAEYLDQPPSVTLTKYEADHIQVACSVEFDLKPTSEEFVKMREQVLFAIADATKRNGVQFAIPAIQYETRTKDDDNNSDQFLAS